jgi:hypothetical protein
MIVRCLSNTSLELPEAYLDPAGGYHRKTEFDLSVGRDYTVYAFTVRHGQVWYYLCGDLHSHYPVIYPAPLFLVVKNSLSKYWVYRYTSNYPDQQVLIAFDAWVSDPYFYDRLTDLEENEMSMFLRLKNLMDNENN